MITNHKGGAGVIGRHGDVLLMPAVLPASAVAQDRQGDILLALGEVTGHAHRIRETSASIFVLGDDRYLVVETPTDLTHEEHGTLTIAPGTYRVIRQVEYVPAAPPRTVAD